MSACTLVIPCFNETSRLDLRAFVEHAARNDHRFLFVNDGSTDDTGELLEDFCTSCPEMLSVLHLPRNFGKAEAVRRGVLAAMNSSDARYVGYWDADLATPLAAIAEMERYLREHAAVELLLGARVQLLGRNIVRRPLRHYLGRLFATAASCVLRLPVYDTQCGAKLFRTSEAMRRAFAEPFLTRWLFDVELLARLIAQSDDASIVERIHEFPLSAWQDVAGSKVKAIDFGKAVWQLLRIYRRYPELRRERPQAARQEKSVANEATKDTRSEERTLEELIQ